jgi:hypothetical protein
VQIKMFADPYRGYYAPLTKIKTLTGSNYTGDRPGPKGCFISPPLPFFALTRSSFRRT